MAKRKTRRSTQRKYIVPKPTANLAPSRAPQPVSASPTKVDLAEEYRYVLTDLKRIGLLAASMFALLVVLALLLR